jgi:crossover junction endodeoxyribonuclease RuvC
MPRATSPATMRGAPRTAPRSAPGASLRPSPGAPLRTSLRSSLRILGIDPGSLRLGYGVIECSGAGASTVTYVECGVISAAARDTRSVRLGEIGRGLRDLIEEVRPDVVAMEEAFFGVNVQSTLALGEARGVALFVASEYGLRVSGYPPATVKKTVVGHGRATKEQIGYLVRALLSLRRTPAPDAADALAIAICHARCGDARGVGSASPSRPLRGRSGTLPGGRPK